MLFCKMFRRFLHIAIWLLGYVLLNLSSGTIGVFTAGTQGYWLASLYGMFFNASLFYTHADYFLPKLLNREQWHWYLLGTTSLLLSISLLESYADFIFVQHYPITYVNTFKELWEENLLIHIFLVLLLSFAYRFSHDWFRNERQKQKLKEEKLAAELSFLRAQINPHFLFNTLNNLFSSAQQSQDFQTASGIAKLAKMMRYMLEESEAALVKLTTEIDYLNNYIDLQKMRFSEEDEINIQLKKSGNVSGKMLAPLLLISFVENAFKHGISLRAKSFIYIEIRVRNETLFFQVQNSNHSKTQPNGRQSIGLRNVKERLRLIYPERHNLKVDDGQETFGVQLSIKI
ncbi:MAG: histidine kinase [Bacteroidota bacterium]